MIRSGKKRKTDQKSSKPRKEPWPNQFHSSTETRIPTRTSPSSVSRTLTRTGKKTKTLPDFQERNLEQSFNSNSDNWTDFQGSSDSSKTTCGTDQKSVHNSLRSKREGRAPDQKSKSERKKRAPDQKSKSERKKRAPDQKSKSKRKRKNPKRKRKQVVHRDPSKWEIREQFHKEGREVGKRREGNKEESVYQEWQKISPLYDTYGQDLRGVSRLGIWIRWWKR